MDRGGADHADAVELAEALQAAGDVDRVPHAAKLHLLVAAYVSTQHRARVQPYADRELRHTERAQLGVQQHQRLLLRQCCFTSPGSMLVHITRRVPENEEAVAKDLGHHAARSLDDSGHDREVASEEEEQRSVREALRDGGEVADVCKHDRDIPARHVKAPEGGVPAHDALHHGLGHEPHERLDSPRELAECALEVAHLRDVRAVAPLQLHEQLGRVARRIQVAEPAHEVPKLPQAA
mmetsp:Transcript_71520/g.202885  ORF Transcript_71520/g.202885 Transcript_71520/m.202885 type:complete len:237 (-) Transcript_71520:1656-2366(-)